MQDIDRKGVKSSLVRKPPESTVAERIALEEYRIAHRGRVGRGAQREDDLLDETSTKRQ